ncbi:MAG: hypothetical protein QE510_10040 [Verrucomicrobiota bacterium]|nr:hypothetical protein [Verrucomicrobiota bacterium]
MSHLVDDGVIELPSQFRTGPANTHVQQPTDTLIDGFPILDAVWHGSSLA